MPVLHFSRNAHNTFARRGDFEKGKFWLPDRLVSDCAPGQNILLFMRREMT